MSKKHNGLLWRVQDLGNLPDIGFLCTWSNCSKKSRSTCSYNVQGSK